MTHAADPADAALDSRATELLLVRHGAEHFALALTAAVEVLEYPVLVPLPGAPPALLGLATGRCAALPVFAASALLEVDGGDDGRGVLVIVRDGEQRIGVLVDEVEDVIMVNLETMQQPMASMHGESIVRGVVRAGSLLVAIVDARALVRAGTHVHAGQP
jgi:purine-binding chemotaxis protein CheW